MLGQFRTAPRRRRDIRFVWGGDTAGQGWGINLEWGGMRIYKTMLDADPDFFLHSGDTIYADGPITDAVTLPDGTVWRNAFLDKEPGKRKVAETLDEFRGDYRYNLNDANLRAFNARVPQIWQWDDHEVTNNWSDAKDVSGDARYTEKRVPLLVGRGTRAFLEYAPAALARHRRERARLPPDPLRQGAGRVRHRHAQLPRPEHRQPAGHARGPRPRSWARSSWTG